METLSKKYQRIKQGFKAHFLDWEDSIVTPIIKEDAEFASFIKNRTAQAVWVMGEEVDELMREYGEEIADRENKELFHVSKKVTVRQSKRHNNKVRQLKRELVELVQLRADMDLFVDRIVA
jgi:succinate dehydrogenase/fumarate reductase flavoprotein subunit